MPWISDAEFKAKHKAHLASGQWRLFRTNALMHFNFNCTVCGRNYERTGISRQQLQIDHKRYWIPNPANPKNRILIFGKETFGDVRVVCPPHHGKGVRSDASMTEWRKSYRWLKGFVWVFKTLWKLAKWLTRKIRQLMPGRHRCSTNPPGAGRGPRQ
jgi:hypothetical protein